MLKRLFTEDLGLKVVAISLAIVLEIYFYSPDNSIEERIPATIEFEGLPPSLTVVSPPKAERGTLVRFVVRGPRPFVDEVRGASHALTIKIPLETPESFRAVLDASQLQLPPRVQVVEIEPESIFVQLDKVIRKKLFVAVQKVGEPAAGFSVRERVVPETVTAEGPKGELDGLSVIQTEPIDVSGIRESRQLSAELLTRGPSTTLSETRVNVSLSVTEAGDTRNFDGIPVTLKGGKGGAVEPGAVRVVVNGPLSKVNALTPAEIAVSVDIASRESGRHEMTLEVALPAGVELVEVEPSTVTVTIAAE